MKRRVSFIDEKAKLDMEKVAAAEEVADPNINDAEVQVNLLDQSAAAKPASEPEESS